MRTFVTYEAHPKETKTHHEMLSLRIVKILNFILLGLDYRKVVGILVVFL